MYVDFMGKTPIALDTSDRTPVKLYLKSKNIFTSYRYGCLVHYPGKTELRWYSHDGRDWKNGPSLRHVSKQAHYEIVGRDEVFWHKDMALAFAAANHRGDGTPEPLRVREVVVGDKGKILSSQLIN